MGALSINGQHQTFTVEHTESMLPAGLYQVRIVKHSARKQSICIFSSEGNNHSPLSVITVCHSWIGCRDYRKRHHRPPMSPISIGTPLIPGAMYKGTPDYERITDRLMKCEARGESIQLIISDDQCIPCKPIRYWTEPANHGCPPSNRRVERIDDRTYDIYDGDVFLKTVIIPEKETQA